MKPQARRTRTWTVRLEDGRMFTGLKKREAEGIAVFWEGQDAAPVIEPEPQEMCAIDLVPDLAVFLAEVDPAPECPMCGAGSHGQHELGALGKREYFRCGQCGWTHARRVDEMAL